MPLVGTALGTRPRALHLGWSASTPPTCIDFWQQGRPPPLHGLPATDLPHPSPPCPVQQTIPGILASTLPSHVYTRHRKRLHQGMQLLTAALYPAFGYHRSQNIAGDHPRRIVRAVVVLSRLVIMSRASTAYFQLLGRPMLLSHRLACSPLWLWSVLGSNVDFCRAEGWSPASSQALLDVHALGAIVAGLGLGRWPAEGQPDPTHACSVVINWIFLSLGVLGPCTYLYVVGEVLRWRRAVGLHVRESFSASSPDRPPPRTPHPALSPQRPGSAPPSWLAGAWRLHGPASPTPWTATCSCSPPRWAWPGWPAWASLPCPQPPSPR